MSHKLQRKAETDGQRGSSHEIKTVLLNFTHLQPINNHHSHSEQRDHLFLLYQNCSYLFCSAVSISALLCRVQAAPLCLSTTLEHHGERCLQKLFSRCKSGGQTGRRTGSVKLSQSPGPGQSKQVFIAGTRPKPRQREINSLMELAWL